MSRQLAGNIGSRGARSGGLLSTLLMVDPDRADLPAMAQQLADAGKAGAVAQHAGYGLRGAWRSGGTCANASRRRMYDTAELLAGGLRLPRAGRGESLSWTAPTTQPSARFPAADASPAPPAKAYLSWLATGVPTAPPPADADNGMTTPPAIPQRSAASRSTTTPSTAAILFRSNCRSDPRPRWPMS